MSLFSDAHDSSVMVGGSFRTDWSDAGEVTDIDVGGNTVKKFETVRYVGIEPMAAIDITGMNTLFISLYKTTPSAFEVKLVDWGAEDTWSPSLSESRYVIPETEMPVGEWVTIEIPLSDFEGPVSSGSPNINQLVFAPFDPATDQPTDETFYMDDMYFAAVDRTADEDSNLAITVDPVVNDAESGDVTLTLAGVDADAETVMVTLTDSDGNAVTAAAVATNGGWVVSVSAATLKDGTISAAVDVSDGAGNLATASTSFDLDTTLAVPVIVVDDVVNDAESGALRVGLTGLDSDVVPDTWGVEILLGPDVSLIKDTSTRRRQTSPYRSHRASRQRLVSGSDDPSLLLETAEALGVDLVDSLATVLSGLDIRVVEATAAAAIQSQSQVVALSEPGPDQEREQTSLGLMIEAEANLLSAINSGHDYTTILPDMIGLLFEVDGSVISDAVGAAMAAQHVRVAELENQLNALQREASEITAVYDPVDGRWVADVSGLPQGLVEVRRW